MAPLRSRWVIGLGSRRRCEPFGTIAAICPNNSLPAPRPKDAQSAPCEDGGCGLPPGGVLHRPSQMGRPPSAVTSGRLRHAAGSSSVRLSIIVAIFRRIHFNITYPVMFILDEKLEVLISLLWYRSPPGPTLAPVVALMRSLRFADNTRHLLGCSTWF